MANILVADDMTEILLIYEQTLMAAGHTVVTAKNGLEATKHLTTRDFDLVVTDIYMPKSDGMEVATYAHSLSNRPALLAITGGSKRLSSQETICMGEAFFDESLIKPVSQDVLLSTVNTLLSKRH
ncbi:MAG: response regulator [Methylocystaceae bacterium]|nr:response regulator [Methylocystaceae bacterium]